MNLHRAAPFVACIAAIACISPPTFVCKSNPDCVSEDGVPGICESNGSCSFYDPSCPTTLRRYPDGAADKLASTCVPAGKQCIAQIAAGTTHTCALRSDGAVFCWGFNEDGEVGDGTTNDANKPTQVKGLPSDHKAVQIGTAEYHTCALLDDNTVWCWGINDALNLGQCNGDQLPSSSAPVRVPKWAPNTQQPASPTCNANAPFTATQIALGGEHACAIGTDGSLYCWGENQTGAQGGQAGQDPKVFDDVPGPLAVTFDGAVSVACGDEYSCVKKDENSVWCFGGNALNELGDGTTNASFAPINVSGLSDAKDLVLDDETPCVLTRTNALFCWGNGTTGIFGTDLNDNVSKATRIMSAAKAFGGGTSETICATQSDGTLQCFGANDTGQCGIGTSEPNVTAPTDAKLTSVTTAALGADHTCAVTTDGALWCWGADDHGQLGDGQISPTPVTVPERIDFPCP